MPYWGEGSKLPFHLQGVPRQLQVKGGFLIQAPFTAYLSLVTDSVAPGDITDLVGWWLGE